MNDLVNDEKPCASFDEYNSEFVASRDDVIPFDESEYEKIISSTTTSQDNFEKAGTKKTTVHSSNKKFILYSKSLNSLSTR